MLLFIAWKWPLKLIIFQNSVRNKKFLQNRPEMSCNINSIKTGLVGIKWGFSGTHRTSYISKNSNLYPRQSRITLPTLLWDTLYVGMHSFCFWAKTCAFLLDGVAWVHRKMFRWRRLSYPFIHLQKTSGFFNFHWFTWGNILPHVQYHCLVRPSFPTCAVPPIIFELSVPIFRHVQYHPICMT